jgi:hypothetical protein
MELKHDGTQVSSKGPVEYFTAAVRPDSLFESEAPARARSATPFI